MADYARLVDAARHAVADASAVTRQVQRELDTLRAITKDDRSPVTIGDFAAQAVIARALTQRLGPIRMVAEETSDVLRDDAHAAHLDAAVAAAQEVWPEASADSLLAAIDTGRADRSSARPVTHSGAPPSFWTLDPIDGTKGFIRGHQYSVCLAFIENGTPAVAALGCPNLSRDFNAPLDRADAQGSLYIAVRGDGVFELPCDDTAHTAHPVHIQRLDHRDTDAVSICESVESGHSDQSATALIMQRLGPARDPVRIDSQCKYAVVARGQADAYLRMPTRKSYVERIWDHAAGALIAAEAGCAVTDIHSRQLDFSHGAGLEKNRGIVVAPPRLHGRIIAAIAELGLAV